MNEQIKTLNGQKIFSDSDICRNAERGNSASPEKKMVKIQGILTSRIEIRNKGELYYYGFFKLESQAGEFPVVFKTKPNLKKASQVLLQGNWAKSNGNRPSFTATHYQILKNPPHHINCFYNSKFEPCAFTTSENRLMEKHYRQKHYPKAKEVFHG